MIILSYPLCGVLVAYVMRDKEKRFGEIVFLFMACVWIIAIFGFFNDLVRGQSSFDSPPFFRNIRHAAYLATLSFGLFVYLYATSERIVVRLMALMSAALMVCFVFLSGGRAAALAVLLSVIVLTVFSFSKASHSFRLRNILSVFFVSFLLTATLQVVVGEGKSLLTRFETVEPTAAGATEKLIRPEVRAHRMPGPIPADEFEKPVFQTVSTFEIRKEIWRKTLLAFHDGGFWLGHGPDAYRSVMKKLHGVVHPHNTMVSFLIEWGVLGAIGIISFGFLLLVVAIKLIFSETNAGAFEMRLIGFYGLLSLNVIGLVDGVFYHAFSLVLVVLSFALVLMPVEESKSATQPLSDT